MYVDFYVQLDLIDFAPCYNKLVAARAECLYSS